ncbi:hypothetical protein FAZ19_09910 [Sphingobacterium alkalisoli]|uniref:PBCV-specific basic adaptor domain-containing protein n=1 Tax=Sphingobacterium alkalisoli TaxID=1874115 RepID=A0A4U0H1I7_9SPHI|nr:hypothetical protein [Sphingobacterium alkalisoli]TJY65451.1 hypothetical protein FAZ19_09910 [Sphingobacterium alkalisoli]GGH20388.1 hypothetical protein GCM10011418_25540 [Sphingobacterium alkalisoli]
MKELLRVIILIVLVCTLYALNQNASTQDSQTLSPQNNENQEHVSDDKNASTLTKKAATKLATSTAGNNNNTTSKTRKPSAKETLARNHITGPRGGCYYINSNGNKTYVDRSFCR